MKCLTMRQLRLSMPRHLITCIQSTAPSDDKAQQVSTVPSSTSCTVNSSCKILKCSNDPFESQIILWTTFLSIYRDVKSTLQLLLHSCWT
ncbi:hypothetical protein ACE6H2_004916 [Prunus campanulata]